MELPSSDTPPSAPLKATSLRGIISTATGHAGSYALAFTVSVVLARILTPRDFGLLGMVVVFSEFSGLFATLGFPSALIQREELDDDHIPTAFWTTLMGSLAIWAIMVVGAPLLARLYGEPALRGLVIAVSASIPLAALGSIHMALLSRDLRFGSIVRIEVSSVAIGAIVAVLMAVRGAGVWSLVAQTLVAASIGSLFAWLTNRWRPTATFSRQRFWELFEFGANATGYAAVNYWARQADDLLVGARDSAGALGLYSRAYSTLRFPMTAVRQIVGRVMFPVMAQMQNEPARLRRGYLKALRMIGLTLFPVMAGLYAVAEEFVLVVYGEKWIGMVPFIEIFALLGISQSIATTVGWIFTALGNTRQMFRWGLIATPVLVGSFVLGIRWGGLGVAIAYAAASLALTPISIRVAGAPINLGPILVAKNLWGVTVASGAMALLVKWIDVGRAGDLALPFQLAIRVLLGVLLYTLLVWVLARKPAQEFIDLMREFRANR